MPVYTKTSKWFGRLVREIIGDLTPGQVSAKTGISDTYIYKMKDKNIVPSPEIINKFAKGMGREDRLNELLLSAGHVEVENSIERAMLELRAADDIPEEGLQQIKTFIKKVKSKSDKD